MIITAVFDKKLEAFIPQSVMASENVLVASRNYKSMLRNTFMADNVEDFIVWKLVSIDGNTGEVLDSSKSMICSLSDLLGVKDLSEE